MTMHIHFSHTQIQNNCHVLEKYTQILIYKVLKSPAKKKKKKYSSVFRTTLKGLGYLIPW